MKNEQIDYVFEKAEKLMKLWFELKKSPVKAKQQKKININDVILYKFAAGGTDYSYTAGQLNAWEKAYSEVFVRAEEQKAIAWLECNAKKAPKKFPAFFNNWLSGGWERHRRQIPSNNPSNALLSAEELSQT